MTGGYAIMTFRLKGHCGQSCKTNTDIYGKTTNKKMSGGGNQKQYMQMSLEKEIIYYDQLSNVIHVTL